ncbi:MAG: glycosyltransferase family 4 protein [Bacillota bacterium]
MARKKVLLLVTLSETGGAQKVVYYLASGLDREKFDITVVCAPGGELIDWLKGLPHVGVIELDCLRRELSPLQDLRCLIKLYRLFKRGGFDIVHCHSGKAGILGRLAAHLAGVPRVFFTVHGWSIDESQPFPLRYLYSTAERLAGAVSTGVVCVSGHDLEKGKALRLVDGKKMTVIYNGVPDIYDPDQEDGPGGRKADRLRGELGLGADDIVVGTVMRLAPPKLPLMFLEAAVKLSGSLPEGAGPGVCFVVIGDGPLRKECEKYVFEHNLVGKVVFLGTREDAGELVAGFDVFVLFSSHEGLPLTIIEAMMAGVPVVAVNVGGVGEMVVDGETGYLIDGSDTGKAVGCIETLTSTPGLGRKMGIAGRRRARELFNLEKMVGMYEELYEGRV